MNQLFFICIVLYSKQKLKYLNYKTKQNNKYNKNKQKINVKKKIFIFFL